MDTGKPAKGTEEPSGVLDKLKNTWERMRAGAEIDIEPHGFPIDIVTPRNDLNAQLKVPTKKEGATISKSGWEIGEGTLSRTTSSGTIEEESYEDIVTRLRIKENNIELGVLLSEDVDSDKLQIINKYSSTGTDPKRKIRIGMGEITDVREDTFNQGSSTKQKPGLSFETADDVYQLGFFANTGLLSKSTNFNEEWIPDVVEQIRSRSNQEEAQESQNIDDQDSDAIDKIERLKKLHEEGVLSDSEFEEKKADLLDDV
ncbi:MAG: SHOCT domain-containing protein [Halobacteriales archaeon]|nr:SHOCT domain-containing protein [Halobacteriales archaeon]